MDRSRNRGLRYIQQGAVFMEPKLGSAVIPRGPRVVQEMMQRHLIGAGPGMAPSGFIGGTTSLSEWYIYWALWKILGAEGDQWQYQESYLGGRYMPGGAVVDFVIYQGMLLIGLRIQTFYYHLAAGSMKQATDYEQRLSLAGVGMQVMDIYEQDYINDETGQAALRVVREILSGYERFNPRATGLTTGSY